ncbi:Prefoldin subunit 1 [Echinococcus granulosus]|nr:Prefoldin subunit 1 [Echinococcus granulosus]
MQRQMTCQIWFSPVQRRVNIRASTPQCCIHDEATVLGGAPSPLAYSFNFFVHKFSSPSIFTHYLFTPFYFLYIGHLTLYSTDILPLSLDLQHYSAIIQLKNKTAASNQQKLLINAQIDALSKQIRRSELVTEEITSLPDGVNTYSSIGRMFIQKNVPDLVRDLSSQSEEYKRTIESLKKKLDYVSKGLADAQQGLRDLISAKQQKM